MIIIKAKRQIEHTLKEYRKKLEKIGQLKEINSRKRHTKKSELRRQEIQKAKYKQNGKKL